MDAIERITQRIQEDAQQRADQIRQRAEQDAADIKARYASIAKQESERILARGRQTADERLERLESSATLERRKLELAAKQQLLDEAFSLALDKLIALPEERRIALLAALASDAAQTGHEEIILSPADHTAIGAQLVEAANARIAESRPELDAALTLSDRTRPIPGGLILSDGEVEVNCALDTLIRMQREMLEKDVVQLLFDHGK